MDTVGSFGQRESKTSDLDMRSRQQIVRYLLHNENKDFQKPLYGIRSLVQYAAISSMLTCAILDT